jgi:hypothetical protein
MSKFACHKSIFFFFYKHKALRLCQQKCRQQYAFLLDMDDWASKVRVKAVYGEPVFEMMYGWINQLCGVTDLFL